MNIQCISPLYIDPGTGSMLFSVLLGLSATLYFVGKAAFIKLKFFIGGKKNNIQVSSPNASIVISGCTKNADYQTGQQKAKETAWMYRGQSGERIAEFLVNKQRELNSGTKLSR